MENDPNLESEQENTGSEESGESEQPKPELTPEQRKGIKQRQFTKLAKELGIDLPKPAAAEAPASPTKNEPDYAKLAYLEGKGVSSEEDVAWVEGIAKDSGRSLKDLFATEWFQKDLKERKEHAATKAATPKGTNRTGNAASDSVEHWIAKGTLPEDPKLRREVVKEKRKRASQPFQSPF